MSTPAPVDPPSVGTAAPPSGGPAAELMPPPPVPPSTQPSAPENADGQAAMPAATPLSELTTLRTHILTLTELNNRLQAVRNIPAQLLRPPGSDPNSTLLTHGFKELGAIAEAIRTEKVQDALQAARKSELTDSSGLNANLRRETLKRRRVQRTPPHLSSSVAQSLSTHTDAHLPPSHHSRTGKRSQKRQLSSRRMNAAQSQCGWKRCQPTSAITTAPAKISYTLSRRRRGGASYAP